MARSKMERAAMYENKLKRIIAFAVAVGISLFSIGAGLSHVMISAFEQSTLTKIQEETGTYKKRLIGQIESDFQLLNTTAIRFPTNPSTSTPF